MANIPNLVHAIGNKINTTLASGINNSTLTITVSDGTGFNTSGGYIIIDKGAATEEIVYVESVSGTTLTVATNGRGVEGTSAASHSTGVSIQDVIVKNHVEGPRTAFAVEHNDDGTHKMATLLASVYPVGSIYINAAVSTNPATLLGFGTWAAYGAGRVIVGLDSGQTEFDALGETGGEKTHTLTSDEIPAHTHTYQDWDRSSQKSGTSGSNAQAVDQNTGFTTGSTGGGAAHNNLQPYIVAYMWKRTA